MSGEGLRATAGSGATATRHPHILVLFADQLRADFTSMAGHRVVRTPHMERLARQGTYFTHCCTNSPLCCPVRHSLATGLYPHNSQCWMDPECMRRGTDTYMRRLQAAGYRTGLVGKAHFTYQENVDLKPLEGFVRSLGFEDVYETGGSWSNVGAATIYDDYLKALGLDERLYRYYRHLDGLTDVQRRFLAEASPLPAEHVLDSFIGRTAVDYVRDYDDERPSFLFVGFQGPHEPWDAPEPYASAYDPDDFPAPIPELPPGDWLPPAARQYATYAQYFQPERPRAILEVRANYAGKIRLIDDWIGRILAAYEAKGWLQDTVVIVASDHGDMLGDLGRISKSVFYEGALRVPLVVRLPGEAGGPAGGPRGSGRRCEALVELIDLYPTLLELAGCELPRYRDGLSLLPLVRGQTETHRDSVLGEVHVHTMVRTRHWKYVADHTGEGLQLFGLRHDPLEQRNLVGHPDYRAVEAEMRDRMLRRILSSRFHGTDADPALSAHTSVVRE